MTRHALINTWKLAWQRVPPKRRLVWGGLLAITLLAMLVQLWGLPTWQRWQATPAQVAALQSQWQRMSAMAQAIQAAPAASEPAPIADAATVQTLLRPHWGDQAQGQRQGTQLRFTLLNLPGPALAQGLQTLQNAGWRSVQAQLQNGPQGWSGQMVWQP